MPALRHLATGYLIAIALAPLGARAWTITPRGAMAIGSSAVPGMTELSGVAYRTSLGGSAYELVAVQDSGNRLVTLSASLSVNGSLSAAVAISSVALSPGRDFEGVALGPTGSVLLAEETTPAVRRYDENTGAAMSLLAMPAVFNNDRANNGLESLTRSPDGRTYWTANEEALVPDGPISNTSHGTTVRLQQFTYDSAGTLTLGLQHAYEVDPIHVGATTDSRTRSGLSDLVALPDGSLLALERSLGITGFILGNPLYQYESRIYRVTFDGATHTSFAPFALGLSGQTYTPATKTLLWSGQAGGGYGQNLEGLALGPLLANGDYSILGVVDDGGSSDVLSGNTLVAFTLAPPLAGDFNFDGAVDAADYLRWRKELGVTYLPGHYDLWRANFSASTADGALSTVPEPAGLELLALTLGLLCLR